MSLSRDEMMDLMAYADGELEAEARPRVEALLARSEEARRLVETIAAPAIGAWLEAGVPAHAAKADGIADAVMLRVAAESHAPVVRLDAARGRSRTAAVAVVAGVLALAAGVLLWIQSNRPPSRTVIARVSTAAPPTALAPAPLPAETAAAEAEDIEVNEVEAPAHDVSVYYLEPSGAAAQANTNSVVIWIGDDTPSPGGAPRR